MSKARRFKITHDEGQFLLKMAAIIRAPKMLGKEPLEELQPFIDDWITHLRGTLKAYSPRLTEEKRLSFGDRDAWAVDPENSKQWKLVDGTREKEVRFDDDDLEGGYWIMRLAADPRSDFRVPLDMVGDFIYPLARKLGYYEALRSALGLADVTKAKRVPRMQEIGELVEDKV